jgi:hypothetical protein
MDSIKNYTQLLKQILYNIQTYSGSHSINNDKAQEWIKSQPTKESKLAAQKIIETTIYVTYKETYNLIEKLVKSEYKKIAKSNENINAKTGGSLYMFIGENDGSNYFISILALYFIKQNGFKEPDKYFQTLPSENDITNPNTTLLYFDDMSYSGGQIIDNIMEIYKSIIFNKICEFMQNTHGLKIQINNNNQNKLHYVLQIINNFYLEKNPKEIIKTQKEMYKYINKAKYCKIIYLLLGINSFAIKNIENINLLPLIKKYIHPFFDRLNIDNESIKLFKIKYNIKWAMLYPTIDDLCTQEELFYMSYFFSFGRTPVVSMYYDHKIANPSSTFLRALNFGPVVPDNFDVAHYWSPFKTIMTDEGYQNAVKDTNSYILLRFVYLTVTYYKNVEVTHNMVQNINKPIKFIPFINNCYDINQTLNNSLFKEVNYLQLISNIPIILYLPRPSVSLTDEFKPVPNCKQPLISFIDLLYLKFKNNRYKINNIFKYFVELTLEKPCNLSFYKNIDYKNYTETKRDLSVSKKRTVKKVTK